MFGWNIPDCLVALDDRLVARFDEAVEASTRRAGSHLSCRIGCIHCCIGPFDITPFDADRLVSGMKQLDLAEPTLADRVRSRAVGQWDAMRDRFPGNIHIGVLAGDEESWEEFFQHFSHYVCPILDPISGRCALYASRPLSCRSYGLPVRHGDEQLPPCVLNFRGADRDSLKLAEIDPDPEDWEGDGLMLLREVRPELGNTIVAAVLARPQT